MHQCALLYPPDIPSFVAMQVEVKADEVNKGISEEVTKATGDRDAAVEKEKGLQKTLEDQKAAKANLEADKVAVDESLGKAQDKLDELTGNGQKTELENRLNIFKAAEADPWNPEKDFRFMSRYQLQALTGDDDATFEYLKDYNANSDKYDDGALAKASKEVSDELDTIAASEGEVGELTAKSEKLGESIASAEDELAGTEKELAAAKLETETAEAKLDKTLKDSAAKKSSFCDTTDEKTGKSAMKMSCSIPLHIVKGVAVYSLVCEVLMPDVIKPVLIGKKGTGPTCLWSSKAKPVDSSPVWDVPPSG